MLYFISSFEKEEVMVLPTHNVDQRRYSRGRFELYLAKDTVYALSSFT